MTTGEFLRQLRVLNPKLRVCAFENSNRLAGLHYIDAQGEYQDICGVDKDYVPEYTEWDSVGHIVKSGWRRVYMILLELKLTTPRQVRKVCPGFFLHWSQVEVDMDRRVTFIPDPIAHKINEYGKTAPTRTWRDPDTGKLEEGTVLTDEQNLDIARDIQAKDPENIKEENDRNRWFLQAWEKRGGLNSDKPTI